MFKPALLIIAGRIAGAVAAFAVPLLLVRLFDLDQFGTYKQWFLLYITLVSITQIGMSESLLYFLPRTGEEAGRYVMNSLLFLTVVGAVAAAGMTLASEPIARWMNNPALAPLIPPLAFYLVLMQASIGLETVMTARSDYGSAAAAYAFSDAGRALLLVLPVLAAPSLPSLLDGALAFAVVRLAYTIWYIRREFGAGLRPDWPCFTRQLAYALPFGAYVAAGVAQENFHQYAVSGLFDAATFAIYSIGCLQIPLVDLVGTTVCNVMMVGMAKEMHAGREFHVIDMWHQAVRKLALIFFPLVCLLLLTARDMIVILFTENYLASVPVFMTGVTAILLAAVPMDGLLRVYAKTHLLLVINLLRLAIVAFFIAWFVASFGLVGAVLVTVLALAVGKVVGLMAMTQLWRIGVRDMLPWRTLTLIALTAGIATVPAWLVAYGWQGVPIVRVLATAIVYIVTYVAAVMAFRLLLDHERAVLWDAMERLQVLLPTRYQHKIS